jgi:mannitol-specific phosphotransferase system IIBC component
MSNDQLSKFIRAAVAALLPLALAAQVGSAVAHDAQQTRVTSTIAIRVIIGGVITAHASSAGSL